MLELLSFFDRFMDTQGTNSTIHNKNKIILDKKLPCEYNINLYILDELCNKGVIDVFL